MTVVLGKYGDNFCKAFYEGLRKYREGLSYGEFIERNFTGGETVLRLIDGKHETRDNFFLNPNNLQERLEKDGNVIVVYRGRSGANWKPGSAAISLLSLGDYLKKKLHAENLSLFQPNEPFEKQDKAAYVTKRTGEVIFGEPCTVDVLRGLMKNSFDRIVTMCAHDSRGKEGWIVKKCANGEPWKPILHCDKLPAGEQAKLETLADWTGFLYNVDCSDVVLEYIKDVAERFPGTLLIHPDGTPMLNKDRVVDGRNCIDGGHMDKERNLSAEGQGELNYNSVFDLDLSDASVLVPDDVIMSGGTLRNTVDRVIERGARHIRCVGFHGQFHYLPELGMDSLAMLETKTTKPEYGANNVRVHTSNSIDNRAFHPPLDILPRGVDVCHRILR